MIKCSTGKRITGIIALIILSALITAFISSCSTLSTDTAYTPRQIAEVMIASQDEISTLHPLFFGDDYFAEYLSEIYRAGDIEASDGIICYSAGIFAEEIAVFLLADEADARNMQSALEKYIDGRIAAFTGYAPEQVAILEGGKAVTQGSYIALIICQDVRKAEAAFVACFSDTPPALVSQNDSVQLEKPSPAPAPSIEPSPLPEQETSPAPEMEATSDVVPETSPPDIAEDVYDPQSIIEAYRSGDESGLTAKNKSILDACYDVIFALISSDMSDYEKELAIHDWIIDNTDYDMESLNNAPDASPDPDNDNPYGLLMNGKAICKGYTFTFKLFMDLLGIECIVVPGSRSDGEEHAWNMVRIDGEWYCVDVTWNDPTGSREATLSERHKYFNVTSEFMRETGHVWDESNVTEATAPKLYY